MVAQSVAEEWRPVVGYESHYSVSNLGRVKRTALGMSTRPGKLLSVKPTDGSGYPRVSLSRNNSITNRLVHWMVAEAFIGPRPHGHHINHKDGIKHNNNASNLEYVTPSDNQRHAYAIGLKSARGENNGRSKLTTEQVLEIIAIGNSAPRGWLSKKSREWGVGVAVLSSIKTGRDWTHIPRSLP